MTDLVTAQEAAELLGLTYQGADYLLRARQVPVVDRVGPVRRFRRTDIDRLVAEERRVGRSPKPR